MTTIAESTVESGALAWLPGPGYMVLPALHDARLPKMMADEVRLKDLVKHVEVMP